MNDPYREHPSEEALERFLLSKSPEEELEVVETHILACERCVTQLETLETEIAAAKIALNELETARTIPKPAPPPGKWKSWLTLPQLSFAGAAALLALAAITLSIPNDVSLIASRGPESAIVAAWRPVKLHLNAQDLPAGPVSVELVDNHGSPAWRGTATIQHDKVDVILPRITKSGPHFVRLYAPAQPNTKEQLLREFSIRVEWKLL